MQDGPAFSVWQMNILCFYTQYKIQETNLKKSYVFIIIINTLFSQNIEYFVT